MVNLSSIAMSDAAPLRRLIYRSRSRLEGDAAAVAQELARILETSRTRNQASGLTGALLLRDGMFAQVLEGPPAAIGATFARIAVDPRHAALETLEDGPAPLRAFADWSMAYAGEADLPDIPLTLSFAGLMLNPAQDALLARLRACLAP